MDKAIKYAGWGVLLVLWSGAAFLLCVAAVLVGERCLR